MRTIHERILTAWYDEHKREEIIQGPLSEVRHYMIYADLPIERMHWANIYEERLINERN